MKKSHLILFLLIIAAAQLLADEPFRQHRFNSWTTLPIPSDAIVFVGNSITDMHPWSEAFGSSRVVNRGNSGTITREVIDNMDTWLRYRPAKVFLMIGTNDLGWDSTALAVANNITTIVRRIERESPATEIYLQSILPARDQRNRNAQTTQAVNRHMQRLALMDARVTYIDLYEPLKGILDGTPYSLDNLHLSAYGYEVWCRILEPYVGLASRYPADTRQRQKWMGLWGSNAMRASYFSVLPTTDQDILFFGDEMVKCGEWAELLGNSHLLNRGTGWGYGGNIATTRHIVEGVLTGRPAPKKMLLYTGTEDLREGAEKAFVDYEKLVHTIRTMAPNAPLALVSLLPTSNADGRVEAFNQMLGRLAEQDPMISYLDINSPMAMADGSPNPRYIKDNYLYGEGYALAAEVLSGFVGKD